MGIDEFVYIAATHELSLMITGIYTFFLICPVWISWSAMMLIF